MEYQAGAAASATSRRTVALLPTAETPSAFEALIQRHALHVVHTIRTDARPVLAALIAVQHALEHVADAVVIPHTGTLEPGSPWWVVTDAADLITATRVYPWGAARSTPLGRPS